uniref:Putative ovule protein n=1 Tax=Solanum chacoense TaxID=4108 RepID=A0A0V0HG57_SOLCH
MLCSAFFTAVFPFFINTLICCTCSRVFRKQPLYLHDVGVRSSYTLASPNYTGYVVIVLVLFQNMLFPFCVK